LKLKLQMWALEYSEGFEEIGKRPNN